MAVGRGAKGPNCFTYGTLDFNFFQKEKGFNA
jgi:hypothetical protein